MDLSCGLVGLPNAGKSTLFNAFVLAEVSKVGNYPFCTIEPSKATVAVLDPRLERITSYVTTEKLIYSTLTFYDIAGLVKNAHEGAGLGNKFLAHIRAVDLIMYVLRCFEDDDVLHDGEISPLQDLKTVETELILSDIQILEKRRAPLLKVSKGMGIDAKPAAKLLENIDKALVVLNNMQPLREMDCSDNASMQQMFKETGLLSSKPCIYVCNISADAIGQQDHHLCRQIEELYPGLAFRVCASLEADAASLGDEREEFLKNAGLSGLGRDAVIRACYSVLGLVSFFTVGEKEVRAWPIKSGMRAPEAAGAIHTDFQKGFIRAQTVGYKTFIEHKCDMRALKELGLVRSEGKDYEVQDGDIVHFLFAV